MRRELTGKRRIRKSQRRRSVQGRKLSRRPRAQRQVRAPRTAQQFFSMSKQAQDRWIRINHAVTKMRSDHVSLQEASREYGLGRQTVIRLAGSALRKRPNGRYAAKANDKLLRVVIIPAEQGLTEVPTRDSRQASELGRYSEAVHKYLETGDASALQQFAGKDVLDLNGNQIALMTEPGQLDRFGGPEFSYESFYARSA
jgi:hypothetical protein